MKKTISFLMTFLMLLLSGCTMLYNGDTSSDTYEYSSEKVYVWQDGIESVDSVISQIEENISQRQSAGEITVERETEVYITDEDDTIDSEAGKQKAVIDSEINSVKVQEIKPADINTTGEKPLYYTYLTDSQKQIYRYMKNAAEQMTTGLFSIGAVSSGENRFTDIAVAFRALSADNPQIFWLPETYIMSPDGSALAFSYTEKGIDYPFTPQQKSLAQQQINTTVNNLKEQANRLNSRFEKELFFHDWLCQNVTYNDDGTDNIYSVYGALINGVAVCEGYSRAMQLLCDSVGIPCTVIYGSSRDVGHMWNIINPGDGWYHLDVTWDDDEKYNYIRHTYFNLSDKQILSDHDIFDTVARDKHYIGTDSFNLYLYDCNFESYNYFVKNKLVFTGDVNADAKIVADAALNGKASIEVRCFGSDIDYNAYLSQINITLFGFGSNTWINKYSYLGDSLVLWW